MKHVNGPFTPLDEHYLTTDQQLMLWSLLTNKETCLQTEIQCLRSAECESHSDICSDMLDRASQECDADLNHRLLEVKEYELRMTRSALRRMELGEYGYCALTGEEIGFHRLQAVPTTTMSLDAQQAAEKKRRLYAAAA